MKARKMGISVIQHLCLSLMFTFGISVHQYSLVNGNSNSSHPSAANSTYLLLHSSLEPHNASGINHYISQHPEATNYSLFMHHIELCDSFMLRRIAYALSPHSPSLALIPCHLCRHSAQNMRTLWPGISATCLAHDMSTWMLCDHYILQEDAMQKLVIYLSPNMTDTVFFYDGKSEHAVARLLDTIATSSKAMFWDAAADPTIPGEEIIKKLGYFLLSSDANIALKIMQKISAINVLGPEYNWLVDLRFAPFSQSNITPFMKDGDNTVIVELDKTKTGKTGVSLNILKCITSCDPPNSLTKVSSVTKDTVNKGASMFPKNFQGFNKRLFKVVTKTYPPFVTREILSNGTVKYDGLCIRVLQALAEHLHFEYELTEVKDGMFGIENGTDNWNGMIGQVYRKESDFAAAGLTINSDREKVVDFTFPYWEEPSAVLVRRSEEESKIFWLFKPLHQFVWIAILAAMIATSLTLWIITKTSTSITKIYDPMCHSFTRCFWYICGAFLQQGGFHQPSIGAGRVIAGGWWFLVLVVYGIYTGNLIAFLTVTELKLPFDSLEEMAQQSQYKYGTEDGIIQMQVFQKADRGVYADIWQGIQSDPNNIVPSGDVGFEKVRKESYAFIGDMTFLAANATDDCDLIFIKETFYKVGFGFAMPEGWPYKKYFDQVIMRLVEGGFIERYKRELFPTNQCENKEKVVIAKSITLEDMAGNFLLLLVGIGLALIFLFGENTYRKKCKMKCLPKFVAQCVDKQDHDAKPKGISTEPELLCISKDINSTDVIAIHKDKDNKQHVTKDTPVNQIRPTNDENQNGINKLSSNDANELIKKNNSCMVESKFDSNFQLRPFSPGQEKQKSRKAVNKDQSVIVRRKSSRRVVKDTSLELL